ncbi:hypothetical protein HDU98_002401 [Podochytrium sp. JEL0797]|nr:hypothetical protein HDU98_002401 [Podochytrium sp. JEL0797]
MQLPSNQSDLAAVYLSAALSILSLCLLVALTVYLLVCEWPKKHSFKNMMTPFNLSLLVISVSQVGLFACLAVVVASKSDSLESKLTSVVLQVLIGNVEAGYVYYCHQRIKRTMPWTHAILTRLMPLSPLFFYAPVVSQSVLAFTYYDETILQLAYPFIAAIATLTFDTLFVYAFTRHISNAELGGPEFRIISRHGIATCILCYASVLLFCLSVSVPQFAEFQNLMLVICNGLLVVVFVVLFGMKVSLYQLTESEELRSMAGMKSRIAGAKRALNESQISM